MSFKLKFQYPKLVSFINDDNNSDAVYNSLLGTAYTNGNLVVLENYKIILRKDHTSMKGKVKLLAGGGAGIEPAETGCIGPGMLTGAVFGDVFVAPSCHSILVAIRELGYQHPDGVLLLVKNYFGDKLNFGLALQKAVNEKIPVKMLLIGDDSVNSEPKKSGRRGLAGSILVYKIAGAMAEAGKSLEDIFNACRQRVLTDITSVSMCLAPSRSLKWQNSLPGDTREVIIGIGAYGQPGVKTKYNSLNKTIGTMINIVSNILLKRKLQGPLIVLLNNLGASSKLEEGVVCTEVISELLRRGFTIARFFTGTFMPLLDSKGFSITLLKIIDPDTLTYIDAPASAPNWPVSIFTSIDRPIENPVERQDEKPAEKADEKPAEKPAEKQTEKQAEKPAEKQTEKQAEKPAKKPSKKSAKKSAKKPDEEPNEKPDEKPAEKPAEEPDEKPDEKPAEEPDEKPDEKPAEEPDEKPAEKPDEKPAEESDEKVAEKLAEKQDEKPNEEPAEKPDEKPVEEPDEKPDEKVAEKLAEKQDEKPNEEPDENPVEKQDEKPTKKPDEKPAEEPDEKPAEKAAEKPAEEPDEKPDEKQAEKPAENPAKTPDEKPDEKLAEKQNEKSAEEPDEKLAEKQDEKADEKQDEKVDEKLAEKADEKLAEKPAEKSDEKPDEKPVENSTKEADAKPNIKCEPESDTKADVKLFVKPEIKEDMKLDLKPLLYSNCGILPNPMDKFIRTANMQSFISSVIVKPNVNHTELDQLPDNNKPQGPALPQCTKAVKQILTFVAEALISCEKQLNSIDMEVGDGDAGTMLKKGAVALKKALEAGKINLTHPYNLLQDISKIADIHIGGTTGALYYAFLSSAAQPFLNATDTSLKVWCEAFKSGVHALKYYGGAKIGERTLLDPLQPAIDVFQQGVNSNQDIRRVAANIACTCEFYAERTRHCKPYYVRGNYVNNLMYPDPGAHAVSIWIRAISFNPDLPAPSPGIFTGKFLSEEEAIYISKPDISKKDIMHFFDDKLEENDIQQILLFETVMYCRKNFEDKAKKTCALINIMHYTHMYFTASCWRTPDETYIYFKESLLRHSMECPPMCTAVFEPEEAREILLFFIEMYMRNLPLTRLVSLPHYKLRLETRNETEEGSVQIKTPKI